MDKGTRQMQEDLPLVLKTCVHNQFYREYKQYAPIGFSNNVANFMELIHCI